MRISPKNHVPELRRRLRIPGAQSVMNVYRARPQPSRERGAQEGPLRRAIGTAGGGPGISDSRRQRPSGGL